MHARYIQLILILTIFKGKRTTLEDLEDLDRDLAKGLRWILDNSVEGLDQTFTYEYDKSEEKGVKELIPDGFDTIVTDDNKDVFVAKICDAIMVKEVKKKLDSFLEGFHTIISRESLTLFTPPELHKLIAGASVIDVTEMKDYAVYSGCEEDSEFIKWLWSILHKFSQKELAAFLFFVSG